MCTPTCIGCDKYGNAVAIFSVAYEQSRNDLRSTCTDALRHGLTVADLAQASGRSEAFITDLIGEGTL